MGNTWGRAFQKPRAPSAIASFGSISSPALQLQQQFFPALFALAIAIANGQQFLFPLIIGPNHHQDAGALFLKADVEIHPISPKVGVLLGLKGSPAPGLIFRLPHLFELADRGSRQPAAPSPMIAARAVPKSLVLIPLR